LNVIASTTDEWRVASAKVDMHRTRLIASVLSLGGRSVVITAAIDR
jgi:hypothetical protein